MKLTYIPINDYAWEWLKTKVPILQVEDSCGVAALDSSGQYVAACVMDNWTNNSVMCTFAIESPSALKEGFLRLCCSFIFEEQGRKTIYAQIADNNKKSLKFVRHMGFIELFRLPDYFEDGVGSVILSLTKDNCKYLLDEVA